MTTPGTARPGSEPLPATSAAERRRDLFVCAAVIPVCFVLDLLAPAGSPLWIAVLVRVIWSAVLVAAAVGIGRSKVHGGRILGIAGIFSALCFVAIVAATGGAQGPMFVWMLALPMAIPLIAREQVWAIVTSSGIISAAMAVLLFASDAPPIEMVRWLSLSAVSTLVSILTSFSHVRALASERALTESRLLALAQMAEKEREHAHAERLALVGQLAAGVAHEVNNPLAFIIENVQYLRDRCQPDRTTDADEAFSDIQMGLDRIKRIVGDLRSFCRGDTAGVEGCEVRSLVDEALRIASLRLGDVRVSVDVPELPQIRGNRTRLVQVLLNLLFNAGDALGGRGNVTIRARPAGGSVTIAVEDDGPGIAPEVLPRLFQPFITTKSPGKGTGLGLAVSREYVERAGGTLRVENRSEGGARFTVECPLWEDPADHGPAEPIRAPAA